MSVSRTHAPRRALSLVVAGLIAVAALVATASSATAAPRIEVSPATDLDPAGQKVTVRGSGYDEFKGIYVVWCVKPPAGEKPTPCGGGEDRDGSSGSSVWVSSNPPMYGLGLAEPYDGDGGFEVEIVVSRYIQGEDGRIDCFVTECVVATRNDHERGSDRSQDAFASVEFTGQGSSRSAAASSPRRESTSDAREAADPTPADAEPTPERSRPAEDGATPDGPETEDAEEAGPADATPMEEDPAVSTAPPLAGADRRDDSTPEDVGRSEQERVAAAGLASDPPARSRTPLVLAAMAVLGSGVAVARVATRGDA